MSGLKRPFQTIQDYNYANLVDESSKKRIVNEAGYIPLSKIVSRLQYTGEMKQLKNFSDMYDCKDFLDGVNVGYHDLYKMDDIARLAFARNLNEKIADEIYQGKIKKKSSEELAKLDALENEKMAKAFVQAQTAEKIRLQQIKQVEVE